VHRAAKHMQPIPPPAQLRQLTYQLRELGSGPAGRPSPVWRPCTAFWSKQCVPHTIGPSYKRCKFICVHAAPPWPTSMPYTGSMRSMWGRQAALRGMHQGSSVYKALARGRHQPWPASMHAARAEPTAHSTAGSAGHAHMPLTHAQVAGTTAAAASTSSSLPRAALEQQALRLSTLPAWPSHLILPNAVIVTAAGPSATSLTCSSCLRLEATQPLPIQLHAQLL
jgi:hypothetical protein